MTNIAILIFFCFLYILNHQLLRTFLHMVRREYIEQQFKSVNTFVLLFFNFWRVKKLKKMVFLINIGIPHTQYALIRQILCQEMMHSCFLVILSLFRASNCCPVSRTDFFPKCKKIKKLKALCGSSNNFFNIFF